MLSSTASFTSLFSSLYTDAIFRKASAVLVESDTSTCAGRKQKSASTTLCHSWRILYTVCLGVGLMSDRMIVQYAVNPKS